MEEVEGGTEVRRDGCTPGGRGSTGLCTRWFMYSRVGARSGVNTAQAKPDRAGQGKAGNEWRGCWREWARSRSYVLPAERKAPELGEREVSETS